MELKKYLLLYESDNQNTYDIFNTLDSVRNFLKRCHWITDYKIIECGNLVEVKVR